MLKVPNYPISVIDFHGTEDDTIPYNINSPECVGEGPQGNSTIKKTFKKRWIFFLYLVEFLGTLIAFDGYYYYPKATVIARCNIIQFIRCY